MVDHTDFPSHALSQIWRPYASMPLDCGGAIIPARIQETLDELSGKLVQVGRATDTERQARRSSTRSCVIKEPETRPNNVTRLPEHNVQYDRNHTLNRVPLRVGRAMKTPKSA